MIGREEQGKKGKGKKVKEKKEGKNDPARGERVDMVEGIECTIDRQRGMK